jgi:hypothetical protein
MAIPAGMGRQVAVVLYVVAMAAVIVGIDFVFFRNRYWERLTVNIGIVLVFAALYFRFLRRPWEQGAIASFRCDCADALRLRLDECDLLPRKYNTPNLRRWIACIARASMVC